MRAICISIVTGCQVPRHRAVRVLRVFRSFANRPDLQWFRRMKRAYEPEILDSGGVPEHLVDRAYRDLTRLHRLLGDTGAIIRAIQRNPFPARRILDIGCARGGVLRDVQRSLGVAVTGIDLSPAEEDRSGIHVVRADAVRDSLPEADIAYCMHMAHHLTEAELAALIRNVGRSCRRFIMLDLVRHQLPLILFRTFLVPFISGITGTDGLLSIRRSYSSSELRTVVAGALEGSNATFSHSVSPLWIRQMVDISW
jgi:SAM-dependent methyltransferase